MGRPGHISPCTGEGCIVCARSELSARDLAVTASLTIQIAIHKCTRDDRLASIKLWRAKILVDEAFAMLNQDS